MRVRIQFRWLLPLTMTAVQLSLFAWAAVHERGSAAGRALAVPAVRAAMIQEEMSTQFQPMLPPPSPRYLTAAIVLNLPAMAGGIAVAEVFQRETDASIVGFSVLFVPLVWYPIGKWLDGQFATVVLVGRRSRLSRAAQWALRMLAVIGLVLCLFSFQGGWEGQDDFSFIPLGLWSSWYLFCSFWGEHRLRRLRAEEGGFEGTQGV